MQGSYRFRLYTKSFEYHVNGSLEFCGVCNVPVVDFA